MCRARSVMMSSYGYVNDSKIRNKLQLSLIQNIIVPSTDFTMLLPISVGLTETREIQWIQGSTPWSAIEKPVGKTACGCNKTDKTRDFYNRFCDARRVGPKRVTAKGLNLTKCNKRWKRFGCSGNARQTKQTLEREHKDVRLQTTEISLRFTKRPYRSDDRYEAVSPQNR